MADIDEDHYQYILPEHFIYSSLSSATKIPNLYSRPGDIPPLVQKKVLRKQKSQPYRRPPKPLPPEPDVTGETDAKEVTDPLFARRAQGNNVLPEEESGQLPTDVTTLARRFENLGGEQTARLQSVKVHVGDSLPRVRSTNSSGAKQQMMSQYTTPVAAVSPMSKVLERFDEDDENVYQKLSQVPRDLSKMEASKLADCLRMLGMEKQAEAFLKEHVDGEFFVELGDNLLKERFGFDDFEIVKLRKFQRGWRPAK